MNDSNFSLDFLNSLVNPENYNDPVKKSTQKNLIYSIAGSGLAKEYQVYSEIGRIVTGKGWIITDKSEEVRFVKINREIENSGLLGRLVRKIISTF